MSLSTLLIKGQTPFRYFFWVNIAAIIIQALLVSRLVKHVGLAGALFALPLIAFGTYSLVAFGAGFAILRAAKTAENATDYSVMNTVKQMLWLPASKESKFKAKQAIDTFFVRAGDVISAGIVFAGTQWLALNVAGFAKANILFVIVWVALGVLLLREYRKITAAQENEARSSPDEHALNIEWCFSREPGVSPRLERGRTPFDLKRARRMEGYRQGSGALVNSS